jgi:GR25 family glycosyltransferase involved in LPS biosynthesis
MQKSLKSIPNLERIDGVIKDPPSYVKISKGQYGCTLAHLNVLRKIANFPETDQIDPNIELWYLVFEDDIEPLHGIDSFNEKVNNAIKFLPSTANIINMGMSSKIFEGYNMVSGYLNQNKYLKGFRFCTQSYGCTPAGARAMIKAIENNKFSNAIDVVLNRTYMNSDRAFFIWLTIQNRGKDSESDIKRIDNYKM